MFAGDSGRFFRWFVVKMEMLKSFEFDLIV